MTTQPQRAPYRPGFRAHVLGYALLGLGLYAILSLGLAYLG